MKLYGWEKVNSAEEYRAMIEAEYHRLKEEQDQCGRITGLEEVKLRLFLSLLEKPVRDLPRNHPEQAPLEGSVQ